MKKIRKDTDIELTKELAIEWLNLTQKEYISDDWEYYGTVSNHIEIRKKYNYSYDGYRYKFLYLSIENTKDYLFLKSKGYKIDITY